MGVSDISADAGRASPSCWGPTKGQVLVSTVEGRCFQSGCRENTEDAGRTLKCRENTEYQWECSYDTMEKCS